MNDFETTKQVSPLTNSEIEREKFEKWWNQVLANSTEEWTTLERLAALDAWNARAALSTEAQPEVTGAVGKKCPNCDDVGWYADYNKSGDAEQVQCEFCYTEPLSIFNINNAIEAAVREKLEEAAKIADHEYRAGIIEKDKSWAECAEYIRDAIRALMESPQPSVEEPAN